MFRRTAFGLVLTALFAGLVLTAVAVAAAGVDITVTEGQSFTKKVADITGCNLAGATINWGDGTAVSVGSSDGGTGVQGTHTYAEAGTYNATVKYSCLNFSGQQTVTFQATVQDAPLTAAGRDVTGVGGQTLTATVAHFTDANAGAPVSDFSAQIAWGDGTTSAGSVAAASGGGFDVLGTHTYATAGSFTVTTSIADVGGSTAMATATAQVTAPPPPPPRTSGAPVVSGEPREAEPLTTTNGTWSGSPTGYQYQWLRCSAAGGDCTVLPDTTASGYTPTHADVGSTLRARVRATNDVGTSLPADSAPTAAIQPLVVRARFAISPDPTCTGLITTFDGSLSKTPNPPITRYKFTEMISSDYNNPRAGYPYMIADGSSARAQYVFSWTQNLSAIVPSIANQTIWFADPRIITLTVTDSAGATNSYSQRLDFAQPLSNISRSVCADAHQRVHNGRFGRKSLTTVKATKTKLSARIPCVTAADCAGTFTLKARTHRGGKYVPIAANGFFSVPAKTSATISAKLNAAGRALVKKAAPIKAVARLTTISPTGQTTAVSHAITIAAVGKHH